MESVEFAVGLSLLFFSISWIFRQKDWLSLIEHVESKGNRAILLVGVINTAVGSFILGFHWIWTGMSLIVSVIGIFFLLRGFLCLTCPQWVLKKIQKVMKRGKTNLRIAGLVTIIISGAILHNWWLLEYGWEYGYQPLLDYRDVYHNAADDNPNAIPDNPTPESEKSHKSDGEGDE